VALQEQDLRTFLLGSGLAAWYFYQEMDPQCDALDPASPLYAFTGLLTGTILPTASRSTWCARSPLTGIWGESNVGGYWGAELRFAGLDGLVLTGRSPEPVYLWIDGREGILEVRSAKHLWGRDHFQTVEQVRAETDPKAHVVSIGPAGENLVRFAAVMEGEPDHARAAGRGGMGALMGSKRLKAIAVRGTDRPDYADKEALRSLVRTDIRRIRDCTMSMSEYGTSGGMAGAERVGGLPLKNWREGSWPEGAQAISGQRIRETYWVKHTRCFACPIGCGKAVKLDYAGEQIAGHGPEYETLAGFGAMLMNDDLPGIIALNDRCNRYGLDTISTSSTIAFATEAFERGLLGPADTDGLTLSWGDTATALLLVDRIARREGFGDRLAEGTRALAQELGPEAEGFAPHVKGLEFAYHDPRAYPSMAVNFATANRGACHLESLSYWNDWGLAMPELGYAEQVDVLDRAGQAGLAVAYQNYMSLFNPLGLCKFIGKAELGPSTLARWMELALGWDLKPEELLCTGERIFNLKRLINQRLGISRQDDTLPARFLQEPRPEGGAAGRLPDLAAMLQEYDRLRGWRKGRPTAERLDLLGLNATGLEE
jgi:aldehyde:ferredoxin oxidoreductase